MMLHRVGDRRAIAATGAVVVLMFFSATDTTPQQPTLAGNPTSGERLFAERGCVRCHAIWGIGGDLGPDLGEVGLGRSLMQLAGMFWNHTPRMIETVQSHGFRWSTFTESELADVISYIYYVKLFDEPGDAALGARWMREKRCSECHEVGGEGGQVGPALDMFAQYVASIPLAEELWNHGRVMREAQADSGVPVPRFSGSEIADIQEYIRRASRLRGRNVVLLPPPDPARGERLFQAKSCSACHGASGRGTPFGPDLRTAIQQLRVSEITGELWNHSARMTEVMEERGITYPLFARGELTDVVAYLYYLRFGETEGDRRAGEILFAEKGCGDCHTGDQPIGPDLARSEVVGTQMGVATAMWNHAPSMYQGVQRAGIPWPLFRGNEMRDLAAYLQELRSHRSPEPR